MVWEQFGFVLMFAFSTNVVTQYCKRQDTDLDLDRLAGSGEVAVSRAAWCRLAARIGGRKPKALSG